VASGALTWEWVDMTPSTTWATMQALAADKILTNNHAAAVVLGNVAVTTLTNAALTASRMVMSDANKKEVSAAASGAVPVNADGSASTAAQVVTLLGTTAVGRATGDASGNAIASTYAPLASPSLTTPAIGAATATTLVASGIVTAQGFDSPTNVWVVNASIGMGTNAFYSSGAATIGIPGLLNGPTSTERYGELTIMATGTVTFTNFAGFKTSDFLTTRTLTNGNTMVVGVSVIPGLCTNMAIVQFR